MASTYTMNLVTGAQGKEHITSADDGSLYASMYGTGQYVMHGFTHSLVNSNLIRIAEGDALINGRHCRINHGYVADLQLASGSNGLNRIDLVVITYQKNTESDEKATLDVLTGKATSGTAKAPSYEAGNVLNGDTVVQFPLYRINYTGINMPIVTQLFKPGKSLMEIYQNIMAILIPPVGWIEENTTGNNPSERYPGTSWKLYGVGRFGVCVNASDIDFAKDKTGGAKKINLSTSQMPKHHHITYGHSHEVNKHYHGVEKIYVTTNQGGSHTHKAWYDKDGGGSNKTRYIPGGHTESSDNFIKSSGMHTHDMLIPEHNTKSTATTTKNNSDANTSDSGTGSDITILPPYITLYRWKRVN